MNKLSKQVSVESLAEEYLERKRRGESPAISEYETKYPDLADEIQDIFPAMVLMEDFKPASGDLSDESASSRPAVPSLKQVADYRILKEIGRGGMGVVYEAEQQSLGRRVALKVLPKSSVGGTKMLDRFQREARAAAKMHHTNIVPVFEIGSDDQCAFYAMQLIQGQGLDAVVGDLRDLRSAHTDSQNEPDSNQFGGRNSLAHSLVAGHFDCAQLNDSAPEDVDEDNPALIETIVAAGGSTVSASLPGEGDLSTAEDNRRAYFRSVAEIGHQCAEALSYAHARGIIHRDIKPSNLLLDTNGVVWVTDFGLAKTNDVGLTQTGDILGTIRYMSPERFKGQCDNRADVYSLGLTLYELLVLKPAYESPDRLKLIDIVTKKEVATPRSIDARIPRDLETIVLKACDKDAKRRYQSADDMAEDLQRFLNDEPILARRVSPTERVARWSRRNPWLATAMSVATAALVAITGISMVAAQTQTLLNQQLTDANEEQKQLNAELKKKTDEQNKTNQALVQSNKSKEELIRDLKKSQSRLAEKQAEFVAEKGDLAESMLWLAKSYELLDDQNSEYGRNLLSKLEAAGAQMPRLVHVEISRDSNVLQRRGAMQEKTDEERTGYFRQLVDFGSVSQLRPVLSSDQRLMAVPITSSRKTKAGESVPCLNVRIWDVDSSSFIGKTIELTGIVKNLAIHSGTRQLAAVKWKPNDQSESTSSAPSSLLEEMRGTRSLVVWSIVSGKPTLDVTIDENVDAKRHTRMQVPIRFRNEGTEVVRASTNSSSEVVVRVYAAKDGEVLRETNIELQDAASVAPPILSRDGRRVVCHTRDEDARIGRDAEATLRCYGVDTGEQIGETIHHTNPWPVLSGSFTLLTPNGSRVACRKGSGDGQRIEILDFETGKQTGADITFPRLKGYKVRLLNASPDGSRLAVCTEPPRRFSELSGLGTTAATELFGDTARALGSVHVYDVETGRSLVPKIPSTLGSQLVAMPSKDPTMTVRTSTQIRTWRLPHSPLQNVLIPWRTQGTGNRGSIAEMRGSFSFQQLMTIRLSGARSRVVPLRDFVKQRNGVLALNDQEQILVAQKTNLGSGTIQIQRWDRKSGRLLSTNDLPSAATEMVGPFDPQGRFLLTGSILEEDTRKARIQVWNAATGARHGDALTLPKATVPMAVSPDGNSVLIAKFQRGENVPPRRRGRGNGFGIGGSRELSVLHLKTNETQSLAKSQAGFPASGRFSADGRYVIFGTKGDLRRHDLQKHTTELFSAHDGETFQSRGLWTSSSDGDSIASTDGSSTVFLQRFVAKTEFGGIDNAAIELKHPAAVTSMAFDPKGGVFVTAASDGIVRQWALPEKWQGEATAVRNRIERHTGLALTGTGDVVASKKVANGATNGEGRRSDASTLNDLTDKQLQAIRLRNAEEWADAEDALAAWSAEQPTDWRPDVLRLRTLVQLGRIDEADKAWNRAVKRIGSDAAFGWLTVDAERHSDLLAGNHVNGLRGARYNNADPESASITAWYTSRLLERAPNNATKARLLLRLANALELEVKLDDAADAIDKAVALQPDSADIHYYRAHLMERLNRWDDALHSRQELVQLEPEHIDAHYRVVASHLFSGNKEAYAESWAKFLSDKAELLNQKGVANTQFRDRVAKLRLIAGGSTKDGDTRQKALELADRNFAAEDTHRTSKPWVTLTKGIAEFRRDEEDNLASAIEHLDTAKRMLTDFPSFGASNFSRGVAITRFYAAMAHHKLGRSDVARKTYLDGLDRHARDEDQLRISSTLVWADWQLAEVARREAAALLKIDEKSIDQPVPDTSEWKVLLEEDFEDGLSEDWKQVTGNWTVVDGAACGTLEQPQGAVNSGYGRLEHEIADLPSTFEVEYEVWTSAPMLAACFLRRSGPADQLSGHRVALASYPDIQFTNQGKPGKGVNLVAQTEFGHWIEGAANDFKVRPNQHYNVRIIRQPQRITVFIDGQQLMSHRVRNIETKTIRFFARGKKGMKMYVDSLRIRIPATKSRIKFEEEK